MPITTDLSVSPYFDDSAAEIDKRYVRIIHKPTIAVQTRELNAVQGILQNQLERLGNNLFKNGTIIDGCNFSFYDNYAYVKINDLQINNEIVIPENFVELFLENENGLVARVINFSDGFEATDPNLKTLYVNYINSGNSQTDTSFSTGQVLTAYNSNNSVFDVTVNVGGSGYSNTDVVVFTPVLVVNKTSGSFNVGDHVTDSVTGADGVITKQTNVTQMEPLITLSGSVSITTASPNVVGSNTTFNSDFANGDFVTIYSNNTAYNIYKINVVSNSTFMNLTSNSLTTNSSATYANTTESLWYVSYVPNSESISNVSSNTSAWSFSVGSTLIGSSNSNIFEVVEILGEGATANVAVNNAGQIYDVTMSNLGDGYSEVPQVSVKSGTGTGANLAAQNYYAQVTVSSLAAPTGHGYAFGVSKGLIYQKGYIIDVEPQIIIIDKYSSSPDDVVVGFQTNEDIINSNIDNDLLDNAAGSPNYTAPGADRLQLTANLITSTVEDAQANVEFFDLVQWSNGYPFKQNQRTMYNVIGDDEATRTYDIAGNVVIDRFLTTTTSPVNTADEGNFYNVVVDPGSAYVEGYKIQTLYNYVQKVSKETSTKTAYNTKVSLNYNNYVRVNNLGGYFEFDRGNTVYLYDTAKGFLSNTALIAAGNTSPVGKLLGTAMIRNLVLEQGTPGAPDAVYRMYLFNINLKTGANIRNAMSVFANTSSNGIADIIQTYNTTSNGYVTQFVSNNNTLIFNTGFNSILGSNNIYYEYRTIDNGLSISSGGLITVSLTGSSNRVFPYSGTLTDSDKLDLMVIPQSNLYSQSLLSGTVTTSSSSNAVTGTATSFLAQISPNQYLTIDNGSTVTTKRVTAVVNNTFLTLDSNVGVAYAGANTRLSWPANVPVPIAFNGDMSANVNGTGDTLTINIGSTLNVVSNTAVTVAYNVEYQNPTPNTKTPNRDILVKLDLANNAAATTGPWCLGVPDVFRLNAVYLSNSSTVNTNSSDVTSEFYVDINQNANYYDLAYLVQQPSSSLILTKDDYLLVSFDCFTSNPGLFTVASYVSSNVTTRTTEDSKPIANLTSTINTFEIPELFDTTGNYYDLINSIDFRPVADATANVTSVLASASLNPANTLSFASGDRYFPVPDSMFTSDVNYFLSRYDTVMLDKNRNIVIIEGNPGSNSAVGIPNGTMRLNNIFVPTYPSLPYQISSDMAEILNKKAYSGNRFASARVNSKKIIPTFTQFDFDQNQPMVYTDEEIGNIDRRLRNVEYTVSLSLLQSQIQNQVIPSSISPDINRFKYGFFVDDYYDTSYSDTTNPEYFASVQDGYAEPHLVSFNTIHTGNITSQPYTSVLLLAQGSATTPPVPVTPPPVNPPPVVVKTTYQGTMTIVPPQFKSQSYTIVEASPASTTTSTTSSSGGKIVCTAMNEAYGFGSFRNAIWIDYSRNMKPEYEIGYHKLFLPLVNRVYRSEHKDDLSSKLIKKMGERIARKRTVDLWKLKHGKMDLEGRIYRLILEPICYFIGKYIK